MKQLLLEAFTVQRKLPASTNPQDVGLFEHELDKRFPAVYLHTLKNAFVLKDLVFSGFKFYIRESLSYAMPAKEQLKRLPYILKRGDHYEKCAWITDDWSMGYFHWFADALPRLIASEKYIQGHQVLLHENFKKVNYTLESLDILGFEYVFYSGRCKIDELLLPGHIAPSGNYNLPLLHKIRGRLLKNFQGIIPHRKIYISRAQSAMRKLQEEEDFIALIKKYGFEIHHFENYSLEQQMHLMQETQFLLGMHGGGLTNIYFMQENAKVLELRFPKDALNNCYFSLASAINIRYHYFIASNTSADFHVSDMIINRDEFEKALQQFLAGDHA